MVFWAVVLQNACILCHQNRRTQRVLFHHPGHSKAVRSRFSHDNAALVSFLRLSETLLTDKFCDQEVCKFQELTDHLKIELPSFRSKYNPETIEAACESYLGAHKEVAAMFTAAEQLPRLLLVRGVTSCESERSFTLYDV